MCTDDRRRVAIVCPWIARHDAIGAIARDTFLALDSDGRFDVAALATRIEYPELRGTSVAGVGELLLNPRFLEADLVIYHFPIHHPFFDAMLVGNGKARQVVRFHNVTPKPFMDAVFAHLIDRSFDQIQNFRCADEIWADSGENAAELARRGIDAPVRVIPPPVQHPGLSALSDKAGAPIRLLFVGRIVPSKGILDLIAATARARQLCAVPFELDIVGNLRFSAPAYLAALRAAISASGLDGVVRLVGAVDDASLADRYRSAHLFVTASRHEGFCVPVIEGLRAGCIPVAYGVGALPETMGGLGRTVAPGSVDALTKAVAEVVAGVDEALREPSAACLPLDSGLRSARAFKEAAGGHVARFSFDRFRTSIVERAYALAADCAI
jgi:glycosyltransferase involved in cell wall biosynthesis